MRVTDRMIYDNATRFSGAARDRMSEASDVASSGIRVSHPGDDPVAAGQIITQVQAKARADAIAQSVSRASDEVNSADQALASLGDTLSRARQLAMQLANGSYTAADRAGAAGEVTSLLSQAVSTLNARVGNRYVFSGTKDDVPPFDPAGNYQGDTQARQVEIAPGLRQDVSVRADVAFKGVNGGVDVLQTLQDLATALAANDVAGVQATLPGFDTGTAQLGAVRSQLGAMGSGLEAAGSVARFASLAAVTATSHLEDADSIEAASKLALAQRALESSLTAAAQSFKLSLLGQNL